MNSSSNETSPRWGTMTKFIVALVFVVIMAVLVTYFRNILGPLLLAFILSYLIQPVAEVMNRKLRISWRVSVSILYLLLLVVLLGIIVAMGITLITQAQSLVTFLQNAVQALPDLLESWSQKTFTFGPFQFGFQYLSLSNLTDQLIGMIQPLFSQAGTIIGNLASGAASTIGWIFFILLISYFILAESRGMGITLSGIEIPGHQSDLQRLQNELGRIWNAFLRGQLIIMAITIVIYTLLLLILGTHYYFALAIVAGLAIFIPYIGPFIAWSTYFLVALFQGGNIWGLDPFYYALLVVGVALLTDSIMNNLVIPRIISDALNVHPGGGAGNHPGVRQLAGTDWNGDWRPLCWPPSSCLPVTPPKNYLTGTPGKGIKPFPITLRPPYGFRFLACGKG